MDSSFDLEALNSLMDAHPLPTLDFDPQLINTLRGQQFKAWADSRDPSKSRVRFRSTMYFLTYSQCEMSKEEMLDQLRLIAKWQHINLTEYSISHEFHQVKEGDMEPGHHLHVMVKFDKVFQFYYPRTFDVYFNDKWFHPCIRTCDRNVLKYVQKYGDYISNIQDIEGKQKSMKNKKAYIGRKLQTDNLKDVVDEFPCLMFNLTQIHANVSLYSELSLPEPDPLPDFFENPWGLLFPVVRNAKKRHYWVWSHHPNSGKTTKFAEPMVSRGWGEIQTHSTKWSVKPNHSVVILDDYNSARLTYDTLNLMCDGNYGYNRPYLPTLKLTKPYIIVCSNQPPEFLYPYKFDTVYARFTVVRVDVGNTYICDVNSPHDKALFV